MISSNEGLVTAIIPTYNHGRYVFDAVQSVLRQTYEPVEVIVVDDGSTDDTFARLAPLSGRINYIYQSNRGLSAARNRGISSATGAWIALLDADDVWHERKIELQMRAVAEHNDAVLIGANAREDLQFGEPPKVVPVRSVCVEDFLTTTPFGPSSAMIRKRVVEEVGLFDDSLTSVEDRDMWLRIAAAYRVITLDWPCWYYRLSLEQMSRNPQRMLTNFERVLAKFFRQHAQFNRYRRVAYSFMHLDAAWCHYEHGRRREALTYLARSFLGHPGRIPNRQSLYRLKLLARFVRGKYSGC